jgi:hypothetical protein
MNEKYCIDNSYSLKKAGLTTPKMGKQKKVEATRAMSIGTYL